MSDDRLNCVKCLEGNSLIKVAKLRTLCVKDVILHCVKYEIEEVKGVEQQT